MALDFPNSPSVNETFTDNNTVWKWDGVKWNIIPAVIRGVEKSATAPSDTSLLWADTSETADSISVTVGTTTTGAAGSSASVVNSGNQFDAVFDFTIPQGIQGEQGIQGIQGVQGATGPSAIINTDGDPGQTLYVGTVDPSVDYSPVTGDVWLEVPS
jgi:hypothetical protein